MRVDASTDCVQARIEALSQEPSFWFFSPEPPVLPRVRETQRKHEVIRGGNRTYRPCVRSGTSKCGVWPHAWGLKWCSIGRGRCAFVCCGTGRLSRVRETQRKPEAICVGNRTYGPYVRSGTCPHIPFAAHPHVFLRVSVMGRVTRVCVTFVNPTLQRSFVHSRLQVWLCICLLIGV